MHRLTQPNVWDGYLSLLRTRGMAVDSPLRYYPLLWELRDFL